jgi:molybdopterin converting factor small subunit
MDTRDILTLAVAAAGAAIGLGSLVQATLEYVKRGKMERLQVFFDLRRRLKEPRLNRIAELIDETQVRSAKEAVKAERSLAEIPLRDKRDYLGLFEEVGLALEKGLLEPDIAHYMFGYYALHCADCDAFWIGVGRWNPYWSRFYGFCQKMEVERKKFEESSEVALAMEPLLPAAVEVSQKDPPPAVPVVTIRLPPTLRFRTGGLQQVEASGATVREALEHFVNDYPGLRWDVFSMESELESAPLALNRYLNIYYDNQDVRVLEGLDTPIEEGATLILLPALAGG